MASDLESQDPEQGGNRERNQPGDKHVSHCPAIGLAGLAIEADADDR